MSRSIIHRNEFEIYLGNKRANSGMNNACDLVRRNMSIGVHGVRCECERPRSGLPVFELSKVLKMKIKEKGKKCHLKAK